VTARTGSIERAARVEGGHRRGKSWKAAAAARFRPPPAHVELVRRSALLERLTAHGEPLVLFCAPAGSGKTMAMRQWAGCDPRPVVWVRLEPADDDPVVLLRVLAEALDTVTPVDPSVVGSLGLKVPPVREIVLPLLADALAAAGPFLLVLDDAHAIAGERAWDVVDFVVHHLPAGAQLAVGTRVDPELSLARLRASGELAEIRMTDLAFDEAETAELVRLNGCCEPAPDAVRTLLAATEGWPAALRFA
jgi:LuxR family maltose regulon positive regulatory protein